MRPLSIKNNASGETASGAFQWTAKRCAELDITILLKPYIVSDMHALSHLRQVADQNSQ